MSSSGTDVDFFSTVIEDYLSRLDRDESPPPEEYLAKYPQFETELREFFENLNLLDSHLSPLKEVSAAAGLGRWFGEAALGGELDSVGLNLPEIPGFELLDELGGGSQGVVYKARQLGTNRMVALKVIREGMFASVRERGRFENEVQLASRLKHPNIVAVYECGQHAGRDYFAMEYLKGEPLDTYAAARRLEVEATVRLFLSVVDAVSYAHQRAVIHRDLKPSNVIVDESGAVHILDFGLAKELTDPSLSAPNAMTRVGDFAGTWWYASPEQVACDPLLVDVRSDVYTLGVILFELLTSRFPYPVENQTRESIARHIRETPPERPSRLRSGVNNDLETILLRSLDKQAERRYQSAAQLADDLRRYLCGDAIQAKRDSTWYVLRKTLRRHRWRVGAAAAAVAALVVFSVIVWMLYSNAKIDRTNAVAAQTRAEVAQETTTVRMDLARSGQRFMVNDLSESQYVSNRFVEICERNPDLCDSLRPPCPATPEPWEELDQLVSTVPANILDAVRQPGATAHGQAAAWLSAWEDVLAFTADSLRGRHLPMANEHTTNASLLATDLPKSLMQARGLCEIFVARARFAHQEEDRGTTTTSLDAALAVSLDIGDGNLLHHKISSTECRSAIYGALITMLWDSAIAGTPSDDLAEWVFRDPPLAFNRLGLIAERQRLIQIFEGVSVAGPGTTHGVLDMDSLRSQAGPFFDGAHAAKRGQNSVTPTCEEVMKLIELYITEVEGWDNLTFRQLSDRSQELVVKLPSFPAWNAVWPVFPNFAPTFHLRGKVDAERKAARLVAVLCQYRAAHGRWPAALDDADLPLDLAKTIDPYIGRPFGYRLVNGIPALYSVNEDDEDNDGKPGAWGEAGTDVVFFPACSPCTVVLAH